MPHPLEASTVRILRPDGSTTGTGFLVSKHLVVTCAHIVHAAGAKPGDLLHFEYYLGSTFARAKVLKHGWSVENDIAILELTEKPPKGISPIIMQSSRAMEGRSFQALGFPEDGIVNVRWAQGNVNGIAQVKGYANPLIQIQGTEIDRGLSGSAVVDHTNRRVFGMITAYQDLPRPNTSETVRLGYVIPIETIWKVYPELENELPSLPNRSTLLEGVHLLPTAYDYRIQNLLVEYKGSSERPELFGGRENELATLDNWLHGSTPRLLLTAPAGRGKTSLLIHWIDRLLPREDLAIAFVPISVRFRTNQASVYSASLAARLAYLHYEVVPTDMAAGTSVYQGLAESYLRRSLPDGKKLLVVLDGIDEAENWASLVEMFPMELPANVYLVVSARLLGGDSDARSWLSRLGWRSNYEATTLDLSPLSLEDVADVLRHMSLPLDDLSHRVDIIRELYRLSEGDPLLLKLYVENLYSRGEQLSTIQPEDLYSIKPGTTGNFEYWLEDQAKLLASESSMPKKAIRLVIHLLAGAMSILPKNDLVALGSEIDLSSLEIDDALNKLKHLISITDPHSGIVNYAWTHPRLRDYFWETLDIKEKRRIDTTYVNWCEKKIEVSNLNDLPYYVQHNYALHRVRAKSNLENLKVFLCHSSLDKPNIRPLYDELSKDGFDVWFDEVKLLGGQKWEVEIPRAVQTSDVVMVCLSRSSLNKTGYVQKEIKIALDVADLQPDESIYIIPVRLEACEVPQRLQNWQWVNLFDDGGYRKLLKALAERKKQVKGLT